MIFLFTEKRQVLPLMLYPEYWMEPANKTVGSPERDSRSNLRPAGDGTPLETASSLVSIRRFYTLFTNLVGCQTN